MKLPKIKISKKTKQRAILYSAMFVYSFGAALFGAANHEAGIMDEWDYLRDSADKHNKVWIHEGGDLTRTDNMYLMAGRKLSEALYKDCQEYKKDEQTDDTQE